MRIFATILVLAAAACAQVHNFQFAEMGGSFYASSYAGWTTTLTTPIASPGLATVIITPGRVTLNGTGEIVPVTAGVPVQVQDGAASEVVTPTAAACSNSACQMTATFAFPHPGRCLITSATDGLDEAVLAASSSGGTVILGPTWTGTQAQIADAPGSTNVLIFDTRAGGSNWYIWNGAAYAAMENLTTAGGLDVTLINGIVNAGQSPGATPADQILTAYQAAAGRSSVQIPAALEDGYPTATWFPSTSYSANQVIADPNGNLQQCTVAGTSGAWPGPAWPTTVGATTTDGTVTWTRIAGSVYGSVLFDLRTGSQASPTTSAVPFPFAKIFIPLWDDSAPANPGTLSWPFQPLNNFGPTAFSTVIHEAGSANPAGFAADIEENAPELNFGPGTEGGASYFSCNQNFGDTHRGCWGTNQGITNTNLNQQDMGDEVNAFNDSGANPWYLPGQLPGPIFGFAATIGGGHGGTSGLNVDTQGTNYGWLYGVWAHGEQPGTGYDFLCGDPYGTNRESACVVASQVANAASVSTEWAAETKYAKYASVLDGNGNVEVATSVQGKSGSSTPVWVAWSTGATTATVGHITTDGGVNWSIVAQGNNFYGTTVSATWAPSTDYSVGALILDGNGNVERADSVEGISNGSAPSWATGMYATTVDNNITWTVEGLGGVINYPSLPNTYAASAWHYIGAGGAPFPYNASWQYIPDSGTDPKIWMTLIASENGVTDAHAFKCEANGNCGVPNYLFGGYAGAPSLTPPVNSGTPGAGGYALSYDYLGSGETDIWSTWNASNGDVIASCWYDESSTAHCNPLVDRNDSLWGKSLNVGNSTNGVTIDEEASSTTIRDSGCPDCWFLSIPPLSTANPTALIFGGANLGANPTLKVNGTLNAAVLQQAGAAVAVVGADIDRLSQVISTHLSAPLPITQGGTGIAVGTGSGAVVLADSPNLTTPSIGGGSNINKVLLTSGTLTFTAITAQSCQEQTLALSGAAATGVAAASPAASLGNVNLSWSAWVSAANTVSVRVCNSTAGSVTPNVASWNVEVVQ